MVIWNSMVVKGVEKGEVNRVGYELIGRWRIKGD